MWPLDGVTAPDGDGASLKLGSPLFGREGQWLFCPVGPRWWLRAERPLQPSQSGSTQQPPGVGLACGAGATSNNPNHGAGAQQIPGSAGSTHGIHLSQTGWEQTLYVGGTARLHPWMLIQASVSSNEPPGPHQTTASPPDCNLPLPAAPHFAPFPACGPPAAEGLVPHCGHLMPGSLLLPPLLSARLRLPPPPPQAW